MGASARFSCTTITTLDGRVNPFSFENENSLLNSRDKVFLLSDHSSVALPIFDHDMFAFPLNI